MWGGMASHTPPPSSVLGRPLALLERRLRALPNNFDPSDATQASNPLRWSYGSGDGAVITLVGVDGHRWEVSCLAVERRYERIRSLVFAHLQLSIFSCNLCWTSAHVFEAKIGHRAMRFE